MAYFKIGNNDYSNYVNALDIIETANYNAQTNAAGNTVVDFINTKRSINVGIIPLNDTIMRQLQTDINNFNVQISFRNPKTGTLETNVNCILPENSVQYYTIQANTVLYQAFTLSFMEL